LGPKKNTAAAAPAEEVKEVSPLSTEERLEALKARSFLELGHTHKIFDDLVDVMLDALAEKEKAE